MFQNTPKSSLFGYTWKSRGIVLGTAFMFAVGSFAIGSFIDAQNLIEKNIFAPILFVVSFPFSQMVIRRLILPKRKQENT